MTGKKKHAKPDWVWDVLAAEFDQQVWDAALAKLRAVGEKGATLTEPECAALLRGIEQPKKQQRPGRPRADLSDTLKIAQWCQLYAAFMPLKAAVEKTADEFGVSRTTVYAARRKAFPSE
jgi:hypothetical protein